MSLDPGTLTDPIHIQQHTQETDAYDTPVSGAGAWTNLTAKPIWANVKHLSGSESIKADASVSVVRASVRIRWRAGINAGMRVVYAGMVYDIEAILPGGGRQHMDLVCKLRA